ARVADVAWAEYQADLANRIEPISWEEMLEELGLTDEDLL
ncbi:antitoxin, partial [Streptococcus suis]